MKIDFERVYFNEVGKYLLFKSNPEKYYLLRVMDFNGGLRFDNTIENPEKIEQGSCVVGEYLLTKEEFELWDTDENAFRSLVDTLSTGAPSDRALKMYYQLTPQSAPVPLKMKTGAPTGTQPNLVEEMKNDFAQQQKAVAGKFKDFIDGKEDREIYFIYSNRLNKIFPAIDFEGKIFFTEGKQAAENMTKATAMFGNEYYQVSSQEAKAIVEACKKYGVFKIVFCQENGEAVVFDRDALLGSPTNDKWTTYNSAVYNALIRCIECGGINNPQVRANQLTLTSQLSHQIFKTTFLVAVNMPNTNIKNTVLLSTGANILYKESKFAFSGAEDYKYETIPENTFNIRTLVNTQDQTHALPIFTGMDEFKEIFKDSDAVPLAVTIEEAFSMKNENCRTIIINPMIFGFVFVDEAMQQLREMSKKPITVFKAEQKTEQETEEKKTTVTLPEIPRTSSTEDILHMVANQINRTEAVKKENIIKKQEEIQNDNTDTINEFDTAETTTSDEIATKNSETTNTINSDTTNATQPKITPEATTENTTVQSDNYDKKGGFFSRFKRKKK